MEIQAVGIPWYSLETYGQFRAIAVDSDEMPDTYMQWIMQAKELEQEISSQGKRPIRAHMDVRAFPEWCKSRALNVDSKARAEFANHFGFEVLMKEKQNQ